MAFTFQYTCFSSEKNISGSFILSPSQVTHLNTGEVQAESDATSQDRNIDLFLGKQKDEATHFLLASDQIDPVLHSPLFLRKSPEFNQEPYCLINSVQDEAKNTYQILSIDFGPFELIRFRLGLEILLMQEIPKIPFLKVLEEY